LIRLPSSSSHNRSGSPLRHRQVAAAALSPGPSPTVAINTRSSSHGGGWISPRPVPPWWRPGPATRLDPALPWRQLDLACRCCRADLSIHLVDLRWRFRPRVFVTRRAPCAARSGHTAAVMSSCWVHLICCCSAAAVSFWFAGSLIGIESPTARRPRAFYSTIGIDFIDTVSEYYVHLLRAIGLLLCRLIGPQHRCPCVHFVVASSSPSSVHRRLCCAIPAAPSVCTRSSSC